MFPPTSTTKLTQLLRRGYEILANTRRHTAEEMLVYAEKIERLMREECREGHKSGCIHVVLAAIEEP